MALKRPLPPDEGGGRAPPAKRGRAATKAAHEKPERTMDPVRVHLAQTFDDGHAFVHGTLQMPSHSTSALPAARFEVLPPRAEQGAHTLASPDARPLVALLGDTRAWEDYPPRDLLRLVAAPEYFRQAAAMHARGDVLPPLVADAVATLVAIDDDDDDDHSDTANAGHLIGTEDDAMDIDAPLPLPLPPPPKVAGRETAPLPAGLNRAHAPALLDPSIRASAKGTRSLRLMDAALGPLVGAKQAVEAAINASAGRGNERRRGGFHAMRQAAAARFYAADPVPDPELPFGCAPHAYPMCRRFLEAQLGPYAARHATMREATERMPRAAIVRVTAADMDAMREPADAAEGKWPCVHAEQCRCFQLALTEDRPEWAYVARSFLTPAQEAARRARRAAGIAPSAAADVDGPAAQCIDCMLYSWSMQVLYNNMRKHVPEHPINTIDVVVGEGGYARDAVLPNEIGGFPTKIEGHVPRYDASFRQYEQLPDRNRSVRLREVNTDFWPRLSQTNTCLGVRKLRALAGPAATTRLPRALLIADAAAKATGAGHLPAAWVRFVRTAPLGVLADRALVLTPTRLAQREAQVPAVWLRRFLVLDPPTPPNFHSKRRPIDKAVAHGLSPAIVAGLSRALGEPLATRLHTLLDAALTTFERSVAHVAAAAATPELAWMLAPLTWLLDREAATAAGPWALDALWRAGRAMPRPAPLDALNAAALQRTAPRAFLLWTTCLWRVAVAALASSVLRPWAPADDGGAGERFVYAARLFADVHLDALAAPRPDTVWLAGDFASVYPQATRVCCAEELPDMTPTFFSTNMFFDMPIKKQYCSLLMALVHSFFKTRPQVCMRREFSGILVTAMRTYPAIDQHVRLVLRAALLGNLPHAQAPLPLAARIVVNYTFRPSAPAAAIHAWITQHPMTTMALMREFDFCAAETSIVIDAVRGVSKNLARFKALARQANAQLRRFVTGELCDRPRGLWQRPRWALFETRVDGKTSVGEVLRWHDRQKDHNVRLKKDTEIGVMLKKLKAAEAALTFDAGAVAAWMRADGRLEALHVSAWIAARARMRPVSGAQQQRRTVLSVAWLKWLGMSQAAFEELRYWLHMSSEYEYPDDSFLKLVRGMYRRDWRDFVLLKTALLLVSHYDEEALTFASARHTREQWLALRQSLDVPPYAASPPHLGTAHYCQGCLRWATRVTHPSRELLGMLQLPRKVQPAATLPAVQAAAQEQQPLTKRAKKTLRSAALEGGGDTLLRPLPPRPIGLSDARAVCTEHGVLNPLDGQLYCSRARFSRLGDAGALRSSGRRENGSGSSSVNSNDSGSDDDDDDDDDDDNNNESSAGDDGAGEDGATAAAGAHDVSRPLLADCFTCDAPLVAVDMVGVYKRLHRRLFGRCVYCGQVCEMLSVNVTNLGLSCGEHALPREYPLAHRLWEHIQRPSDRGAGSVLAPPAPCLVCGTRDAVESRVFTVYDAHYRLARVAFCRWHARCCRHLLPHRALALPPLPLSLLMSAMDRPATDSMLQY